MKEPKYEPLRMSNPEFANEYGRKCKKYDKYKQLESLCAEVLLAFPDKTKDYRAGKTALLGAFTGEVMKRSKNVANPKDTISILKKMLKYP